MDLEQERQLAQDETTASKILVDLSKSKDVQTRRYVANNPNTPVSILEGLGSEFPEEITNNPIFSLLMLEKPDSEFIRLTLARSSTTKPETLEKLAAHHESFVRKAVARNRNTSFKILKKLATRSDVSVHIAITENINTPASILEILAVDRNRQLRESILKHPNVNDSVQNIIKFIDERAGVHPSILEKLAKHHKLEIRRMVANHIYTQDNALEQLAQEDDGKILEYITIHPNATVNILEKLVLRLIECAKQKHWIEVKHRRGASLSKCYLNLIKNAEINLQLKIQLVGLIPSINVLLQIVKLINIPEILLKSAEYEGEYSNMIRLWRCIICNSHTPTKAIERIYFLSIQEKKYGVNKEISFIHDRIYSHQNTSKDIKEEIAKKKGIYQDFIASNPDTPQDVLRKLAYSSDYRMYFIALKNRNLPVDVLESFARHENWRRRKEIAECENTPVHILKMLAEDENMWVKVEVARNPNSNSSILECLACSKDKKIREYVSRNPNASANALDILADDTELEIRLNTINHHNVSDKTLIRIAEDKNEEIGFEVLNQVISKDSNPSKQLVNGLMKINYPLSILVKIAECKYTPKAWLNNLAFTIPNKINNDYLPGIDSNAYLKIMQIIVAENRNTSISTLEKLSESSINEISSRAKNTLKRTFSWVSSSYWLTY